MRADHREDLAVTDLAEDGFGVLARVDHDHFLVIADEPRAALALPEVRKHPLDPSFHDSHLRLNAPV